MLGGRAGLTLWGALWEPRRPGVAARPVGGAGRESRSPWPRRSGCVALSSSGASRTSGRSASWALADHAAALLTSIGRSGACALFRAPTGSWVTGSQVPAPGDAARRRGRGQASGRRAGVLLGSDRGQDVEADGPARGEDGRNQSDQDRADQDGSDRGPGDGEGGDAVGGQGLLGGGGPGEPEPETEQDAVHGDEHGF